MASTFIDVTRSMFEAEFPAPIWQPGPLAQSEFTLDCPVKTVPGVVVRIYTSVRDATGHGSSKGADAIRILAIDTKLEEAGAKPVIVNPHNKGKKHIKRTKSWATNTRDMAREVYRLAVQRADWVKKRRIEAGIEQAPATTLPASVDDIPLQAKVDGVKSLALTLTFPTKKARRDYVRSQINSSASWQVLTLATVYAGQTEDEKASETTTEDNGIGFTGFDGEFGTSLGNQFTQKGWLSKKQMAVLPKMMVKYADQLIRVLEADGALQIVKKGGKATGEEEAF